MRVLYLFPALFCVFYSALVSADYDNGMRYAFVASPEKKSVAIIDLHDHRLADSIQLDQTPGIITASDRLDALVIAYPLTKQLTLIDLSSSRLKQIQYPLQLRPDYLKLDPIGDAAAVYDQTQQLLEIHNLKRARVLARVEDVKTAVPMTFNRDGQRIFWVDRDTGELHVSDLWGKRSSVKLTNNGTGLSAMTRSVDGSMGFISDAVANKVYVVNLRSMQRINAIMTGSGPGRAWGTADGQLMIVPNYHDGTITAISTFTQAVSYTIKTIKQPVAVNTGWLDTTAAVIGETGEVALVNLVTKKMKKLQLHGQPQAGVVTSNSRMLALPLAGFGDMFIFDMKQLSIKERIIDLPADIGAASLAISNNLCH